MNKCKVDKYDVALGKILKEYRVQNNLTLQNVADKVGVTRQMIYCYEHGISALTVTQLIKLCNVYGIDYVTILKQVRIEEGRL